MTRSFKLGAKVLLCVFLKFYDPFFLTGFGQIVIVDVRYF